MSAKDTANTIEQAAPVDRAAAATPLGMLQFKQSLAGMSYGDQVAAIAPGMPLQFNQDPSATSQSTDAAVQLKEEPQAVQMAGGEDVKVDWPETEKAYIAHISKKYAAQIADLKKKGQQAAANSQKLDADEKVLKNITAEIDTLEAREDELIPKEKKRLAALMLMKEHQGKSQSELKKEAMTLLGPNFDKKEAKKLAAKADLTKMHGILLSSMELSKQLNPELTGEGRTFYSETLDQAENSALLTKMTKAGLETKDSAKLLSSYRNWAKCFVRDEIMVDPNAREITYLRDLGVYGRRTGMNFEEVKAKCESRVKKKLGDELEKTSKKDFEEMVYKAVLGSAQSSNEDVNMIKGKTGKKP